MACSILGNSDCGYAFFCTTTGIAFGPVADSEAMLETFQLWLAGPMSREFRDKRKGGDDPRAYSVPELMDLWHRFFSAMRDTDPEGVSSAEHDEEADCPYRGGLTPRGYCPICGCGPYPANVMPTTSETP